MAFAVAAPVLGQTNLGENPTYPELIKRWANLSRQYPRLIKMTEVGMTDSGLPLHLVVIDKSGKFDPVPIHKEGKVVVMIINGIHAGEPDGMVASLAFAEKLAQSPPENVVYCIIPVYNVGGAVQRNSTSRVNQNGPAEYGFRGNARNIDLNRDFLKCDSKNAMSFSILFHRWNPHLLIDTHVSNGADYQHTMTLVNTFPEKLNNLQASFLTRDVLPYLYKGMKDGGDAMCPYVMPKDETPESGILGFTDTPRYSTGYAALFNTIGFMTETHMLKPFENRTASTLRFFEVMNKLAENRHQIIAELKIKADAEQTNKPTVAIDWQRTGAWEPIEFSGFRAENIQSEVTQLPRIRYNREKSFTEDVPYYNRHEATITVQLPEAYILPQAWSNATERLRANGIKMRALPADTTVKVEVYYIQSYDTDHTPYEGHYVHRNTTKVTRIREMQFRKGDLYIPAKQAGNRYLAHIFEPECDDSFFNWNFFDAILSQKEYYSDYIFEDEAIKILNSNQSLKKVFEEKKKNDPAFADNARSQLDFIYKNSPHYEESHMRLPVYRVVR